MTRTGRLLAPLLGAVLASCVSSGSEPEDSGLLRRARALTLDGARSGEGYFNRDGTELVFQSEREPGNPFYQIYWLDLRSGETERVSPGHGKATCAWIHPTGERVLFASTHEDPEARQKQERELERRAHGPERRYSWDYDEHYELYALQRKAGAAVERGALQRLTRALGYDAEAAYSPDGQHIVFASNRHAWSGELTGPEREHLETDPSFFVDLYLMNADGSDVRRLTTQPGYDGGPFFSPDGERIVWRRFSSDGATAEIYTMAIDGSDERQLTRLGAMSWAPFYHPSGRYVIFTTNLQGFGNFELYLVDAQGERAPVRVTDSAGFDGLPVFAPGGERLSWTSARQGASQIFLADWDHDDALASLGLAGDAAEVPPPLPPDPAIGVAELERHVAALTSDAMEGRETGSIGEERAARYIAGVFEQLGLEPAGDDGLWLQRFEFPAGVSLGVANSLRHGEDILGTVDTDWRPLAFSQSGASGAAPVVFAGYGLQVAGESGYDSYGELDVKGKWVVMLRFSPQDVDDERAKRLRRFASLRFKATVARDRGALGMLVVTGPRSEVREPLVALAGDASMAGLSLFAVSVSPEIAERLLGRDLDELQAELDTGEPVAGFDVPNVLLEADLDLVTERRAGRNVLARLPGSDASALAPVVVGAHYDHLGRGGAGSLAPHGEIHRGADDNASGVAVMLEIAGALAAAPPRRDVIFAAWSGEEAGLIGSNHFVHDLPAPDFHADPARRAFAAYLNLDMVGRLRQQLVVYGIGSSPIWKRLLEQRNVAIGLPLELQDDSYIPSDATSFYLKGVPSLTAFTGAHAEYHTPRDTADLLDYEGMRDVAQLVRGLAESLGSSDGVPEYIASERPESGRTPRAFLRAWLGTIPDYAPSQTQGLSLSGVMKGGPAEQAGLRGGDLIVELAGRRIENIYDYTFAIEALKVGETVDVTIVRGGERRSFDLTPRSRQ